MLHLSPRSTSPMHRSSQNRTAMDSASCASRELKCETNLHGAHGTTAPTGMGSYADRSAQSLGSDSTVRELLGLHGSLFTLRFGGRRNCVLTAQEGFLVQFGDR